ncbi:MAG: SLC13 family permease [Gammaproteobacteria bacterium]|nr:SLC13 family permease [Gammaproteobacteria bacterium]
MVDPTAGFHAYFVMAMIVLALVLFANEKLPIASSSLFILVSLTLVFEWFPFSGEHGPLHSYEFLTGFGHRALIAVCALMIAGQGLVRTGALDPVGRVLAHYWSKSPQLVFLLTLVTGALLSAFVNNTPIVILLLPILITISIKTGTSASLLLMPVGFATLMGGMSTTIGTSTNLLVVSFASELGVREFDMFDFFVPAILASSVGILYLWLVVPRIMPHREPLMPTTSARIFTAQLRIREGGAAEGATLAEVIGMTDGQLEVIEILRGKEGVKLTPLPDIKIRMDDVIVVRDTPDNLKKFEALVGARLFSSDKLVDEDHPLRDNDQQIAEVVVVPGSTLDGRTLKEARFTDRYHLLVLALHRANRWRNQPGKRHTDEQKLNSGDVILVQGAKESIRRMKASRNLMVLDASSDLARSNKSYIALGIMLFIIVTAASGLLPIEVSALTGVFLLLLTGCLRWRDATRALSAPVILIIVTSLAMGNALLETGGAAFLANQYVALTHGWSPTAIMSGLMLVMAILTNVVSNNAAAVIGTPIAVSIATQLGLSAEAFVLAVLFGANMSFATPMAYQTNLLVMNAGNYRFYDFVKVGVPLTLLMWIVFTLLLPWLYNF